MEIDVHPPLGASGRPDELPRTPFLAAWLAFHAARCPDAPAVTAGSTTLGYRELEDRVEALAAHLASRGVGPRTRVLLALANSPATIVAALAVSRLGATSVEVNRGWSADLLGEIVGRIGIRHLFMAGRDAPAWRRALRGLRVEHAWVVGHEESASDATLLADHPVTWLGDDGRLAALDAGMSPAGRTTDVDPEPDWPALILYTSGSTGRPHGVIQTHRNIDANSRSIVEYLGLTSRDRALLSLPLYYCYGRSVLQTHLLVGGSVVLDGRMAFPRNVMGTLAAEGCTGFAGVPLTFEILRRKVDIASMSFPRLRYLTQAGGAMAPDTIAWARSVFAPAELYVMYGQTEATARLAYLPPYRAQEKRGSIGIAIPGVELRVVDGAGRELPPGVVGELVARGPNVTPGYVDDPAETAVILRDGWLWTGDLAERDGDGFLYHRGRAREMLKIGGHRVAPAQIEELIAQHPDVDEVAVVGVPDSLMGEVAVAFVVARSDRAPTAEALLARCRASLPAPVVPAAIAFLDALPRNEAGKLLRAELRSRASRLAGG